MPRTDKGDRDPQAKLVLYALCDMDNQTDPTNRVFPSQRKLSSLTGLAESTVAGRLARLEAGGYIKRAHHHHAKGARKGQRSNDDIWLQLDRVPDDMDGRRHQPTALQSAGTARDRPGTSKSHRGSEVLLPGVWADVDDDDDLYEEETDPWWDETGSESMGPLMRVDACSGEIVGSALAFGNQNRLPNRRRPEELWSKGDVMNELLDRFEWADDRNEVDRDLAAAELWRLNWNVRGFDPRAEVAVISDMFTSETFLNLLAKDDGSAAAMLNASLQAMCSSRAVSESASR
jgi:hypothetical protein